MHKKITFFVLSFHALCLAAALLNPLMRTKPKRKPIVVNTVRIATPRVQPKTPPKAIATAPSPKPAPPAPKVQPKPQPVAKPTPKPAPKKEPAIADKKITTQKPAPKPQSAPKPRANISDALKKELEESLSKLNAPALQTKPPVHTLRPQTLRIDTTDLSSTDANYAEDLIFALHQALRLPEIGEVNIQLTLHQDGTVAKLVVIKTQSQKNKAYLEAQLPKMQLPRLHGAYAQKGEHTFTLTFCNEI